MLQQTDLIEHNPTGGGALSSLTASRVYLPLLVVAISSGCAFILASVLTSQGANPMALLLLISGFVLSIYALMRPWPAFLLFLWLSVTIDTLKRITYVASNMTQIDVAEILVVPVLLMSALYLRIIVLPWFGPRSDIDRIDYKKFLPVLLLAIIAPLAMLKKSGLSLSSLAQNYTFICFIPAALAIPHLLNTPERWRTFSRHMLWICLVIGLYGMAQVVHGPFDYERVYMQSGLTTTIGLMDGDSFRPFSLLNTGPTFAGMVVISTLFALYWAAINQGYLRIFYRWVLPLLGFCLVVCIFSTQRGPVLCGLIIFALLPLLRWPRLLQGAFLACILLFALMVWRIDDVWLWVQRAEQDLNALNLSPSLQEHTSLMTFGARVDSFHMLSDPEIWTPFGNGMRSDMGDGHDLLTNLVIWIGYVGLTVFVILLAALIGMAGRLLRTLRERGNGPALLWAQVNMAVLLYILFWSLLFGSVIHISPMNFYFWLSVGNLLFLYKNPVFLESRGADDEQEDVLPAAAKNATTSPAQ